METHVFCVWDFMCLLKRLQTDFTSVHTLWRPVGSPQLRHMINSIVLGEECDVDETGQIISHFELYIASMNQAKADTGPVLAMVEDIKRENASPKSVIDLERIDGYRKLEKPVKNFINCTMEAVLADDIVETVAAFTFGREDLICPMFLGVLRGMSCPKTDISKLTYYLERHVEVDGGDHGPLSLQMLAKVCGNDKDKWEKAEIVAKKVLQARVDLWNYLCTKIDSAQQVETSESLLNG